MPDKDSAHSLEQCEKSIESNFNFDNIEKTSEQCSIEHKLLFDVKLEEPPTIEINVEPEEAPKISVNIEATVAVGKNLP
ncbi:MAG: hypothetical protein ACI8O8_000043 [Oleiphilaceae bacterium]|jgi:hypothetical protein